MMQMACARLNEVQIMHMVHVFLYPLQVWPFFAWGLLVIAMNAARYEMLKSCASSIALLNIINSVLIRHHHVFFFSLVGCLACMH